MNKGVKKKKKERKAKLNTKSSSWILRNQRERERVCQNASYETIYSTKLKILKESTKLKPKRRILKFKVLLKPLSFTKQWN